MQKLPQISQIYTDADLRYSPTEFTEHTEPFAIKICVNLLSMLKSKCFDHYFHFKLRFYIQG